MLDVDYGFYNVVCIYRYFILIPNYSKNFGIIVAQLDSHNNGNNWSSQNIISSSLQVYMISYNTETFRL